MKIFLPVRGQHGAACAQTGTFSMCSDVYVFDLAQKRTTAANFSFSWSRFTLSPECERKSSFSKIRFCSVFPLPSWRIMVLKTSS